MTKALKFLTIALGATLLLSGCSAGNGVDAGSTSTTDSQAGGSTSGEPSEAADTADAADTASLTAEQLTEYVANATWSFSDAGVMTPVTVTLTGGQGTDDLGRVYELGDAVEGDANADGIIDIAIPIAQTDGNGYQQLWYVWLGGIGDDNTPAVQVDYPIGLTSRCGHVVNSVVATESGFNIDETLRTVFDKDLDCASAGSGEQIREINVQEIDGIWYPIQVAPNTAWGGFCPPSLWEDSGEGETGWALLAAPSASAEAVTNADEVLGLFPVAEDSRFEDEGFVFVGYRDEAMGAVSDPGSDPIINCAFSPVP